MPNTKNPANRASFSQIDFALWKPVPDIARGKVVYFNYGEVSLFVHDDLTISRVVQTLLDRQRSQLIQAGGG